MALARSGSGCALQALPCWMFVQLLVHWGRKPWARGAVHDRWPFMELLQSDIFTVWHICLGVKCGILCCLNCNIALTLVINPSYVTTMGLQSELRLNSHFHINWPVVIYCLTTRTDALSRDGQAVAPLRQIPLSAVLLLFLRLSSMPCGTITDSSMLRFYIFSDIERIWLHQPHYLELPKTNYDPFC